MLGSHTLHSLLELISTHEQLELPCTCLHTTIYTQSISICSDYQTSPRDLSRRPCAIGISRPTIRQDTIRAQPIGYRNYYQISKQLFTHTNWNHSPNVVKETFHTVHFAIGIITIRQTFIHKKKKKKTTKVK